MPGASRSREASLEEELVWAASAFVAGHRHGVRVVKIMDCRGRATRAGGKVLKARRLAIYLAAVAGNLSNRALCRATGMDHTTIQRHLEAAEDVCEPGTEMEAMLDEVSARLTAGLPDGVRRPERSRVDRQYLVWLVTDQGVAPAQAAKQLGVTVQTVYAHLAAAGVASGSWGQGAGDKHPSVRVPDAAIPDILAAAEAGWTSETLAARYGVSEGYIEKIISGRARRRAA